jgi:hypothetical protein
MSPWVGQQSVAYVPAIPINDGRFNAPPPNFKDFVTQRLLFDPDANGIDRSLRTYFSTVSYGRANLVPTVFEPVTIPDPVITNIATSAGNAISVALASQPSFQNAAVVFPGNNLNAPDWAFWGYPPIAGTSVTGFCYDFVTSGVGPWAMELTHILTSFGDLYKTSDADPDGFDNMSCSCGVHPSTFTKLKLGWLDESEIVNVVSGQTMTQTLHALSLPRPSPPGRITAFRIPSSDPQHYFLVEARLRTDVFDAGIPSEGVVVYEVEEAVWAPLHLRTSAALGVGQSYVNPAFNDLAVTVTAAVPGGFTVEVQVPENPRCPVLRSEIADLEGQIQDLEGMIGDVPPKERGPILLKIRALKAQIMNLGAQMTQLGCART